MRRIGMVCLFVCLGILLVPGTAVGESTADEPAIITDSDNLVSVPVELVDEYKDAIESNTPVDGDAVQDSVAYVLADRTIQFEHNYPENDWKLELRDPDNSVIRDAIGNSELNATDLDSGTYAVLLVSDDSHADVEAVQPLVVSAYEPTLEDHDPVTTEPGDDVSVDFSLEQIDDSIADDVGPDDIEVGFVADGESVTTNPDAIASEEHSYTVDLPISDDLSADEYQLYVAVRGDDLLAEDHREPIAFSTLATLEVSDESSSPGGSPSDPDDDPTIDGVSIVYSSAPTVNDTVAFSTNLTDDQIADAEFTWTINTAEYSNETINHTFDTSGEHSISLDVDSGDTQFSAQTTITATEDDSNGETDNGNDSQQLTNQTNDEDDDPIPLSVLVPIAALLLAVLLGRSRID